MTYLALESAEAMRDQAVGKRASGSLSFDEPTKSTCSDFKPGPGAGRKTAALPLVDSEQGNGGLSADCIRKLSGICYRVFFEELHQKRASN